MNDNILDAPHLDDQPKLRTPFLNVIEWVVISIACIYIILILATFDGKDWTGLITGIILIISPSIYPIWWRIQSKKFDNQEMQTFHIPFLAHVGRFFTFIAGLLLGVAAFAAFLTAVFDLEIDFIIAGIIVGLGVLGFILLYYSIITFKSVKKILS